jgi:hypothetical protein
MAWQGHSDQSRQKKITDAYYMALYIPEKKMEDVPWELTELFLCEEVYHCRPSELAEEDWETIQFHLELIGVRRSVAAFKAQPATSARGKVLTLSGAG